jgi:hypothetical protein
MKMNMKVLTGVLGGCALIGVGCGPDPRAVDAAHAETERIIADAKAASEAEHRRLYIQKVYLDHGAAARDLYVHCTGPEPPQQPANQKRCQALLDQLQKEDAAQAAADAKAKATW